jgi:hypothetical protein
MRKTILLLIIFGASLCTANRIMAAYIDSGIWTEFYTYKNQYPQKQNQVRSLQGLKLGVNDAFIPGLSVFVRGRVASDLAHKLPTDGDLRVYGAYLEYANKSWLTVRAGRQFLATGVSSFTLDGGRLDLNYNNKVKLSGFAGTTPGPQFYDYDKVSPWKKRNAYGGQLKFMALKPWIAQISLLQQNIKNNTDTKTLGADLSYTKSCYSAFGRIDYDMFNKHVRLISIRPRFSTKSGNSLDLEYFYRRPSLGLSNPFSVFYSEPFHQFRIAPVIKIGTNLHALGSLSYTRYKKDNNTRVTAGASYRGQSGGVVFSNGYGGKKLGIFASLFRDITKSLQAYFYADAFNYKLDTQEDDTTPSLAAALGGRFNILKGLDSQAEIQLLSNNDYKYDTRFYLRLSYGFTSKIGGTEIKGGKY